MVSSAAPRIPELNNVMNVESVPVSASTPVVAANTTGVAATGMTLGVVVESPSTLPHGVFASVNVQDANVSSENI